MKHSYPKEGDFISSINFKGQLGLMKVLKNTIKNEINDLPINMNPDDYIYLILKNVKSNCKVS